MSEWKPIESDSELTNVIGFVEWAYGIADKMLEAKEP